MVELAWQVVGMITILIILMTLAFGETQTAANLAEDNLLNKTFADLLATFDAGPFRRN